MEYTKLSLAPITLLLLLNYGLTQQQPDPSYYFTQTSGRFVPQYQNPRNGFFPAGSLSAQRTAPGTYQEQQLYGVNERPEEDTTLDYLQQFGGFPQPQQPQQPQQQAQQAGRPQDFFQISPRPFTIQPNGNHAFQYPRPSVPRAEFQPSRQFFPQQQQLPQRDEEPFQQTVQLAEPSGPRTPAFTSQAIAQSKRVRPLQAEQQGIPADGVTVAVHKKPNEVVASHETQSTRSRSRFQSTSSTTTTTTTPTPASYSSTPISGDTDAQDRFPNRERLVHTPRFANRGQNVSVRVHKLPRLPIAETKENEETQTPAPVTEDEEDVPRPRRINITHNGSSNNKISSESDEDSENRFSDEVESVGQDRYNKKPFKNNKEDGNRQVEDKSINPVDQVNNYEDERDDKIQIVRKEAQNNASGDEDVEEFEEEDESGDEEENVTTGRPEIPGRNVTENNTSQLSDGTVILTSNFFLPGKSNNADDDTDEQQVSRTDGTSDDDEEEVTTEKKIVTSTTTTTTTEAPIIEYEYEYEDYEDETSTVASETSPLPVTSSTTSQPIETKPTVSKAVIEKTNNSSVGNASAPVTSNKTGDNPRKEIVSVVTTKSVVNGTTSNSDAADFTKGPIDNTKTATAEPDTGDLGEDGAGNTTESWVVVASVQTSRSISGARFLPFPQVEQEEKKQILSDLDKEGEEGEEFEEEDNDADLKEDVKYVTTVKPEETTVSTTSVENTTHVATVHFTTDLNGSILKKIHEKLLHDNVEVTTKGVPVFIRKFSPKTTTTRAPYSSTTQRIETKQRLSLENVPQDDLSGLLPPGFKFRPTGSYKNRKITTTTEKPVESDSLESDNRARNETDSRAYKNKVAAQDVAVAGFLPKDFKLNLTDKSKGQENTNDNGSSNVSDILSKLKFDDNLEKLLPNDYPKSTTKAPLSLSTVTDNINKFLPPGFKLRKEEPKKPEIVQDDVSKFLPPGFKIPKDVEIMITSTTTTKKPRLSTFTVADDVSKFLPPDFHAPADDKTTIPKVVLNDDISKFLPPGFKLNATEEAAKDTDANDILNKIKFKSDIAALLPPGFKSSEEEPASTTAATPANGDSNSSFKVVFPKGINIKRPGSGNRATTARTPFVEGPPPPQITIRKGLPSRATTEFTGWPTVSTTPISIEKILEQQGAQAIDISELLNRVSSSSSSSTSTTTTTTSTTTTTTVKPTLPGLCHKECNLAGTIKIVDGVKWKPELLDHNTVEWKNLAQEVESQLNEVYSKSDRLNKWYRKVWIDSFSQGSVLVDYFVELADVSRDVNTQEIKQMFHDALTTVPVSVVPLNGNNGLSDHPDGNDFNDSIDNLDDEIKPQKIKDNYLLGKFVLDPMATDFIVIRKQRVIPPVENVEENSLIPQWGMAVIVIGVGSLLFVVIFGVAVLLNRQKRSKKKAPIPLTADMLNELNKNHMGGFENYGHEDVYNMDDAWDDKADIKPKRFTNSIHGSSGSNIYDSWRSQRHTTSNYYYDQQLQYPQKSSQYPPADPYLDHYNQYPPSQYHHPHHQALQSSMGLNTYNPRRYYRDYDPDC